jgi:RNA polymerase sigma-70 factor, ECF subfamily
LISKNTYNNLDINLLIAECNQGKSASQKKFIDIFLPYVKSICFRYKPGSQQSDEIINDCFLKIFNNLHNFDPSKPIQAWIRVIAINTCIDYYRKNRKIDHTVHIDDIEYEDTSGNALSDLAGEQILSLIQRLPTSYRLVFTLYVIDGYNHREIAALLGIKEGTSKSNLQDARIKLQDMVKYDYAVLYKLYSIKNRVNENR